METRKLLLVMGLVLVFASAVSPIWAKQLVNMEFKQAPLVEVFQILGELGGYNVLVDPTVEGEVTFALKSVPVEEALDLVTRTTGYRYQLVGNTLVVGSEQRLKSEFGSEDFSFIKIEHVDVTAAQRLVALITPQVKSYVDAEQDLLVLYGLTTDLEVAKQVLKQYDQKTFVTSEPVVAVQASPAGDNLVNGAVPVFYAHGLEILEMVRQQWPTREFRWDEQSQNILGRAASDEWVRIQVFVQEKDMPRFVLKGVLSNAQETLALVEYRDVISLLRQGDVLNDWQVQTITEGQIEFSQGQRQFVVGMGR